MRDRAGLDAIDLCLLNVAGVPSSERYKGIRRWNNPSQHNRQHHNGLIS